VGNSPIVGGFERKGRFLREGRKGQQHFFERRKIRPGIQKRLESFYGERPKGKPEKWEGKKRGKVKGSGTGSGVPG